MAITLTTEWQKVLEASTKVTSNVTGYLRLYMKYGGRNETNNKDIVYYEIRQYAYNPYGNYLAWEWTSDLSWNIKLGTTTKASGSYTQTPAIYTDGKERVKASGNWEQEHNPDGTWTSSISVEGYVYKTKLSASGDIILPTIPRKTTISVTNSSINGISIITLYKNSDSFYHTLYYRNPNTNAKINIKTNYKDKTYEWLVPDDIYKVMSGREIRLTIGCDTYNSSGGLVGNDEKTMVASAVELDARPTFSATIKNDGTSGKTYQLTGSEVAFIKDYTNAIIDTTIGLRKYATLKEFKVTNGNKSSTLEDTTINAIPTKTFTFFVKDSREYFPTQGYPLTQNVDIFIDYFTPKVNSPNIARTEQTSTEIVANISGQFWNGNFGKVQNTLKYAWRSKLAGSNEWGAWSSFTPLSTSNNNFSISNLSLGTTYATNSSYDFQFRFIDALSNLDPTKIVTTATQNVTISTPIVEVYEDEVNVNGVIKTNNKEVAVLHNSQSGTSDGDSSGKWFKIAEFRASRWVTSCFTLQIMASGHGSSRGTIACSCYDYNFKYLTMLDGNIPVENIKLIQSSSDTADFTLYFKNLPEWYTTINATLLSSDTNNINVNVEPIGAELPNNGTIHNCTYDMNKVIEPAFASMTTTNSQNFTQEGQITVFGNSQENVSSGDFTCNTTYSRIDIPKGVECVEFGGNISGYNNASIALLINDQNGQNVKTNKLLVQAGGNGYWSHAIPTKVVKLDKTMSHYLYIICGPYNVNEFNLNAGFGSGGTSMWVRKLK